MSIGRQYTVQEEYGKARPLLEQAHALASALPERSTRGRAACALAQTLANQGDLMGAERLIQEGLQQLQGDSRFALDRVFCLQRGSEVAGRRGEARDGLSRAQDAERALRQSPFRSELLELDNLIRLAGAYRNVGQVRQSSEAFQRAVAQLTALGRDDTQRAGTVLNNWGVALYFWGQPLDSERVLRRAIKLSQDDQSEAAISPMLLLNYARALLELGRLNEAADYAERAHDKAQKGGDNVAVNQSLLVRSSIYRGQGDLERARQMLSEVESILRRSVPPGHIALASLASQRALLAQARGEMQSALELANESVTTAEALMKQGRESGGYLETFLARRAEIQLQIGRREEARSDAARAVKMFEEAMQPGTFSAHLGRAYLALGRSLSALGKEEEAHAALRAAVEQMQSALGPDHAETRSARQLAEK